LGNKVALGAPCLFGGVGDFSGVPVGLGDVVSDGLAEVDGVSTGCAVGEVVLFFRCGEEVGDGVGDVEVGGVSPGAGDFFFRRGEALGVGVGEGFFFLGNALGDGVGDSFSGAVGEDFFFGDTLGVGEGDVFFVLEALLFFLCGVGVGVAKIFFSV